MTQPLEQFIPIGRVENIVEGVRGMRPLDSFRYDEEREIVIAEHRDGAASQTLHKPHDRERLRATIDEIANEPQGVACGFEPDPVQQPQQLIMAALNIADGVGTHCIQRNRFRELDVANKKAQRCCACIRASATAI
jgi:hypothetical protein